MDERPSLSCCLFASDEDRETDPGAYDCASCAVAAALDALYPENRTAWSLYRQIVTRWTCDTGTVALAFDRLTRDLDSDDFGDLLARVTLIYDEVNPVPVRAAE